MAKNKILIPKCCPKCGKPMMLLWQTWHDKPQVGCSSLWICTNKKSRCDYRISVFHPVAGVPMTVMTAYSIQRKELLQTLVDKDKK